MNTVSNVQPKIRVAHDADLAAIEALLTASDLPIIGVRDALCSFLVAEADGKIIGVVGIERHGRYALLRSTAVAQEWRSRGVARRLVDRIIAEAEDQSVNALYLLTTSAERYFPNFGFAITDRATVPEDIKATSEFREVCCASAKAMCLKLKNE